MKKYRIDKKNVIEALHDLANLEFQKIAWFENDQGLMYSFNENISDLFDDYDLDKALHDNVIIFDEQTDAVLRELSIIVDGVDGFRPEEELINSPEMDIIRKKSAYALELIKASDGSQSTVEIIE